MVHQVPRTFCVKTPEIDTFVVKAMQKRRRSSLHFQIRLRFRYTHKFNFPISGTDDVRYNPSFRFCYNGHKPRCFETIVRVRTNRINLREILSKNFFIACFSRLETQLRILSCTLLQLQAGPPFSFLLAQYNCS